ncbi:MAG: hypothetical protein M3Z13_06220 [Candidatus Dormibacteraeota bacterium]|nr:hypothetical protein [Candidatus Dormibacteraeota bacterium]
MSRLVLVGGNDLEAAIHAFNGAGFAVGTADEVPPSDALTNGDGEGGRDRMVALGTDAAAELAAADASGVRYVLVHVGPADGTPNGSFERAHHRVMANELAALATRLRTRERVLVRCIAFGFKHGLPGEADWVIDTRFLDNPYWVPELRPGDGRDEPVRRHVLGQPAAAELLDTLERTITSLLPLYRAQGRQELTVAFGCTGGRHRSVVMATEFARRLGEGPDVDVATSFREL